MSGFPSARQSRRRWRSRAFASAGLLSTADFILWKIGLDGLGAEALDRRHCALLERVREDSDGRVRMERDVDVRLCHEVDGGRVADGAANRHGDGLRARRQEPEG